MDKFITAKEFHGVLLKVRELMGLPPETLVEQFEYFTPDRQLRFMHIADQLNERATSWKEQEVQYALIKARNALCPRCAKGHLLYVRPWSIYTGDGPKMQYLHGSLGLPCPAGVIHDLIGTGMTGERLNGEENNEA